MGNCAGCKSQREKLKQQRIKIQEIQRSLEADTTYLKKKREALIENIKTCKQRNMITNSQIQDNFQKILYYNTSLIEKGKLKNLYQQKVKRIDTILNLYQHSGDKDYLQTEQKLLKKLNLSIKRQPILPSGQSFQKLAEASQTYSQSKQYFMKSILQQNDMRENLFQSYCELVVDGNNSKKIVKSWIKSRDEASLNDRTISQNNINLNVADETRERI